MREVQPKNCTNFFCKNENCFFLTIHFSKTISIHARIISIQIYRLYKLVETENEHGRRKNIRKTAKKRRYFIVKTRVLINTCTYLNIAYNVSTMQL